MHGIPSSAAPTHKWSDSYRIWVLECKIRRQGKKCATEKDDNHVKFSRCAMMSLSKQRLLNTFDIVYLLQLILHQEIEIWKWNVLLQVARRDFFEFNWNCCKARIQILSFKWARYWVVFMLHWIDGTLIVRMNSNLRSLSKITNNHKWQFEFRKLALAAEWALRRLPCVSIWGCQKRLKGIQKIPCSKILANCLLEFHFF